MTCRFDPHWSYRGLECLRVENEHVTVDVLPELGAKIFRLVDKARDHDVLWHSPRVAPPTAPRGPPPPPAALQLRRPLGRRLGRGHPRRGDLDQSLRRRAAPHGRAV